MTTATDALPDTCGGPFHCWRCRRSLRDVPLIRVSPHGQQSVWECVDCYIGPMAEVARDAAGAIERI